MENVTRRGFVGAMGAMGAAALAGTKVAQAEPQKMAPQTDVDELQPDAVGEKGMYHVTANLEEINRLRREQIDACKDLELADGTVIPEVWVRCRAMLDGLGCGVTGNNLEPTKESFDLYKWLCNNDEKVAEIYTRLPLGKRFTAFDASVESGYPMEDCVEALEVLSHNGAVTVGNIAGEKTYVAQKITLGITETAMNLYGEPGFMDAFLAIDYGNFGMPVPNLMTVPVNKELVVESAVYPYDDIDALLERHEIFGVSGCQCRYCTPVYNAREELPALNDLDAVHDFITGDGHHLERCISLGENAEYLISIGVARQISREECREIIDRSINEEGSIPNFSPTKYVELLCLCDHGCDYVPTLAQYIGPDTVPNAYQSHYELMYDKDLCIKCGACVDRCVPAAIELDDEGYPAVTGYCFRCGQCGLGCPVGARTLKQKDQELWPYLPDDMIDLMNVETAYRYEQGLWPHQ